MALNLVRRSEGVDANTISSVRHWAVGTLGLRDCDLRRLDSEEQREVVELLKQADTSDREKSGFDWEKLSKRQRARLERLLATAAGRSPDYFDAAREADRHAAKPRARAAEARRPRTLTRAEEDDFFRAMFRKMQSRHLWLGHVAILVGVIAQMRSGTTLAHNARLEGDGDQMEIVYDVIYGYLGAADPESELATKWYFDWLVAQGWLTASKKGRERRIGLGPKTIKALRGGPA
jgi:hypothetical protein